MGKQIEVNGEAYKNGDWLILTKVPHGGYEIGDPVQILEITDHTGTFSAKMKHSDEIQQGFGISCHRKALPHEIPDIVNNNYSIF